LALEWVDSRRLFLPEWHMEESSITYFIEVR